MQISFLTINKPKTKITLKSTSAGASNFQLTAPGTNVDGILVSTDGENWAQLTTPFVSNNGYIHLETKNRQTFAPLVLTSSGLEEVLWEEDVKCTGISFKDCVNLVKVPTFLWSGCTSLENMFNGCSLFNQDISMWDTSKVTNMANVFLGASIFNQPLNNWDVSNVVDMSGTFINAKAFNQELNNWDTSKVNDMSYMFNGASAFNQPLNNWNTGNVTNMDYIFYGASIFNQNLSGWNVAKVTSRTSFDVGATAWQATNKPKFV